MHILLVCHLLGALADTSIFYVLDRTNTETLLLDDSVVRHVDFGFGIKRRLGNYVMIGL